MRWNGGCGVVALRLRWRVSAFDDGRHVGPLLDAEGAEVSDGGGEPGEGFESVDRKEQVGEVFVVACVDAALAPIKVEVGEGCPMSV